MHVVILEGDPFPALILGMTAEDLHDGDLPLVDLPDVCMAAGIMRPPVLAQIVYAATEEELHAKIQRTIGGEYHVGLVAEPGDTFEQANERVEAMRAEINQAATQAVIHSDAPDETKAAVQAVRSTKPSLN